MLCLVQCNYLFCQSEQLTFRQAPSNQKNNQRPFIWQKEQSFAQVNSTHSLPLSLLYPFARTITFGVSFSVTHSRKSSAVMRTLFHPTCHRYFDNNNLSPSSPKDIAPKTQFNQIKANCDSVDKLLFFMLLYETRVSHRGTSSNYSSTSPTHPHLPKHLSSNRTCGTGARGIQ